MKAVTKCTLPAVALTFLAMLPLIAAEFTSAGPGNGVAGYRVLVFSKTLGYRHDSITNGIAALRQLGLESGFGVDATEDSGVFTAPNLARYATVVFLSATGDVLGQNQETALKSYVLGGGGFVGIHGAVFGPQACEDRWDWYGEMFCCAFTNHSAVVPAVVRIENEGHPANAGLPKAWERTDEWYNFTGTPRGCARILATVDEATYKGGSMGKDHPVAWCRQIGKGRMWYTAMGHTGSSFDEPLFRRHLLGGILITAGRNPADFSPNNRPAARLSFSQEPDALVLKEDDEVLWRFNYGTNLAKPYFHPVTLPGGPVLTWDQPADHAWHHALWFSWKYVDGVNYWETESLAAAERGLTEWREPLIEARPDSSARIVMDLAYRPPAGGPPVLTEHRVIEVSRPNTDRNYYMDWSMTFSAPEKDIVLDRTPIPGEPDGKDWGGYAGLSVRFSKEIKEARVLTTQGPGVFENGKYRIKASAMDYTGVFEGQEAGIAIIDSPANLNNPSPWYAISDSTMHYFSPAVIQYGAHRLKKGESFTLRYRMIIHPGRWDAGQLKKAAAGFGT
jgi:type 1 glutamine amidotransferase